jgi:hypothetical protein
MSKQDYSNGWEHSLTLTLSSSALHNYNQRGGDVTPYINEQLPNVHHALRILEHCLLLLITACCMLQSRY